MWTIVAVLSGLLTGPEIYAITDAGIFKREDACKAAITEAVGSKLDAEIKQQYENGYRQFVCVRVHGAEMLDNIK